MNCPGSIELLKHLDISIVSDEPDYTKRGTAAHSVAADCLKQGIDAWEYIGQEVEGVLVDEEIISGVQMYVDHCRPLMVPHATIFIEKPFSSLKHKLLYSTMDFGSVADSLANQRDYKNGVLPVEVRENPQFMYYAFGIIQHYDDVRRVVLGVVQPNASHVDGPIRTWATTAEYIHEWVNDVLVPAMQRTEIDHSLDPGSWCQFCPAKLVCPALTALFGAACQADYRVIPNLSDESIGRSYQYIPAVKNYIKALEEATFGRLNSGRVVPGTKLVEKRSNRVWKKEAEAEVAKAFPDLAYTAPELKSPAQVELLGIAGKELVKEWAFTPRASGLTVALEKDPRPGVRVQTTQEAFGDAVAALEEF